MISWNEKKQIRNKVLEVISAHSEDIKKIYFLEKTGELNSRPLVARTDEQKYHAIGVEAVTQTRITIAITVRVSSFTNVPLLYETFANDLKKALSEIKYTLFDLKIKVIDIE